MVQPIRAKLACPAKPDVCCHSSRCWSICMTGMWFWEGVLDGAEGVKAVEDFLDLVFPGSVILVEMDRWLWLGVRFKLKFCFAMMHDDEICWHLEETTAVPESCFSSNPYTAVILVLVEHPMCPLWFCPIFGIMLKAVQLKVFFFFWRRDLKSFIANVGLVLVLQEGNWAILFCCWFWRLINKSLSCTSLNYPSLVILSFWLALDSHTSRNHYTDFYACNVSIQSKDFWG